MKRTIGLLVLILAGTAWGAGNTRLRFTRYIELLGRLQGIITQIPVSASV